MLKTQKRIKGGRVHNDLKLICLFCLLAGAGERIIKNSKNKKEKKIAGGLVKLGQKLLDKSGIKLNEKIILSVYQNIARVYPNDYNPAPLEVISFVFFGIFEIYIGTGLNKYLDLLIPVFIRALKVYDPKLNNEQVHTKAMLKYLSWQGGLNVF
jgi:hypothetical protein